MPSPAPLVRRFIDEAWNQGRVAVIREVLTEPYTAVVLNHGAPRFGAHSWAQVEAHVADFRVGLPDLCLRIEDLIEGVDRVFVQTRLTGTHRGPLMAMPATGRMVDIVLSAVYFSNGERLTGHRVLVDLLGLMQQLGSAPDTMGPQDSQALASAPAPDKYVRQTHQPAGDPDDSPQSS